jgi:hypothetical protein
MPYPKCLLQICETVHCHSGQLCLTSVQWLQAGRQAGKTSINLGILSVKLHGSKMHTMLDVLNANTRPKLPQHLVLIVS